MSDPLTAPVEHLSPPLMQVRCLLMTVAATCPTQTSPLTCGRPVSLRTTATAHNPCLQHRDSSGRS